MWLKDILDNFFLFFILKTYFIPFPETCQASLCTVEKTNTSLSILSKG